MLPRKTIDVNIDGIDFKVVEFVWHNSVRLEKKIALILAPILDLIGSLQGEKEITSIMDLKIDNLGAILQKALLTLDDPFLFFKEMFSCTYYPKQNPNGILPTLLDNDEILDEAFRGRTITAIKLCIEIMKINKFSFIEGLGGIGNITGMFSSMMEKEKKQTKK